MPDYGHYGHGLDSSLENLRFLQTFFVIYENQMISQLYQFQHGRTFRAINF